VTVGDGDVVYRQDNQAGGDVFAVQHGDQFVFTGAPGYRLDPFAVSPPAPPTSVAEAPSRLLSARYRLAPFVGRRGDLEELAGWRDAPDSVAVRLVHGPGGQGKTRLAAQFGAMSLRSGWGVWTARWDAALPPGGSGLPTGPAGLLVIVDYAERWSLVDLLRLVVDPRLQRHSPLRVLLLARPAGPWWQAVSYRWENQDLAVSDQGLGPVARTRAERVETFTTTRDRFAEILGGDDPEQIVVPPQLDDDAYRLILTVHMAALVGVDAARSGRVAPRNPADLSGYLLRREYDHWQWLHDKPEQPLVTGPKTMSRAVFAATLTRPVPFETAVAVVDRVGVAPVAGGARQVVDDHAVCYPPADRLTALEPLYPDRLGEDFVAAVLPGNPDTSMVDPWADSALAPLLAHPTANNKHRKEIAQTLTVLVEAARRWPHIARRLWSLLGDQPDIAIGAGGQALLAVASLEPANLEVLEVIERRFPSHRSADLDAGIAAVVERLHRHRVAQNQDPEKRAALNSRLSWRLHLAGRREEALTATEQAIEIHRRLAAANPAAFEPDLARSLTNLGVRLSELGRREEALAVEAEAEALAFRARSRSGT
jgi:hypothetical protein